MEDEVVLVVVVEVVVVVVVVVLEAVAVGRCGAGQRCGRDGES